MENARAIVMEKQSDCEYLLVCLSVYEGLVRIQGFCD